MPLIILVTWTAEGHATAQELGKSGVYTALNDNAVLFLLISFLAKTLFDFGRWFVVKYMIGKQEATESSVKAVAENIAQLRRELAELKAMIPNEEQMLNNIRPHVKLAVIEEIRAARRRTN